VVKNPPAHAGDMGSISGSGRSLGREHGNPLQYSCLGNPMDRGDWWVTFHAVTNNISSKASGELRSYHFIKEENIHLVS